MNAAIPYLTPAQRWLLERADETWRRKPTGVDGRVVARLKELGLIDAKRERGRLGSAVMRTVVRRTPAGRRALGLSPLTLNGDSTNGTPN